MCFVKDGKPYYNDKYQLLECLIEDDKHELFANEQIVGIVIDLSGIIRAHAVKSVLFCKTFNQFVVHIIIRYIGTLAKNAKRLEIVADH